MMNNRAAYAAVQRKSDESINRAPGFKPPPQTGGFPGGQNQNQRQPLQQVQNHRNEQKVIKKEDIPRQVNSAPKEVKQVEVECVAPYDEHKWVSIGKEKDGMKDTVANLEKRLKRKQNENQNLLENISKISEDELQRVAEIYDLKEALDNQNKECEKLADELAVKMKEQIENIK